MNQRHRPTILPTREPHDDPRIGPHNPAQDEARMALEINGYPGRPVSAVLAQEEAQDKTAGRRPRKAPILPQHKADEASLGEVRVWAQSWLDSGQTGSRVLYAEAYAHYVRWCKPRRRKPVPKSTTFTRAMNELGWPEREEAEPGAINYRAKVGGQMWFYGTAIRKQPRLESATA
jgi:hypothetical protein